METSGPSRDGAWTARVHDAWVGQHARLWRSLLAYSGDRSLADDAVAEAFAQALRRGPGIDDVTGWVWRAAFSIAAGQLAARRRYETNVIDRPSPDSVPDEVVALVDALGRLSLQDRQIVVLSLVAGWPSHDVGRLVGLEPGTVRVRLHRAKKSLRHHLEERDA